jgi:hypothetical protein
MRFSWAVTHRIMSVVVAGALSALAFSRDTQGWDVVGAVLLGIAITDVILLVVVARVHWRRRSPR